MDAHAAIMDGIAATQAQADVGEHEVRGGPRADFSCIPCAEVFRNLPVASKRCPVCGKVRGFSRLYDGVQVSTKGRRIAKFIDPKMMRALDEHSDKVSGARKFKRDVATALDVQYERATPETREAIVQAKAAEPGRVMPASAALGMIDSGARSASRNYNMPMLAGGVPGSLRPRPAPVWTK